MKTPKFFQPTNLSSKFKEDLFQPGKRLSFKTYNLNRLLLFSLIALFLAFAGCEEPEKEIIKPKPQPEKGTVTAQAGPDITIPLSQRTLILDASGSKDSQNKTLTFTWLVTRQPEASRASYLSNHNQVNPTFNPDVPGEYELEVTVVSANGESKDRVVVTVTNQAAPLVIESYINFDRVLTNVVADPNQPDYYVPRNVEVHGKLTIEPGVVIEFEADTELHLKSAFIAKGTADQKIVFTGKTKQRGFWKGILIDSSWPENEMEHVEVAFAGSNPMAYYSSNVRTNVAVSGNLKVTNSSFKGSGGYGMYVGGYLTGFAQNNFHDNASLPLFLRADQVHKLDAATTFTGSSSNKGIAIEGTVPNNYEVTWPALADGTRYLAFNDVILEGGVTISPGVTIEFGSGKGLIVKGNSGYLSAVGTEDNKITFTGFTKNKGYWKGISFQSSHQKNQLDYVEVAYGGHSNFSNMPATIKTNVLVYGKSTNGQPGYLRVTNSSFTHSGGYGMYVDSELAHLNVFARNSFSHNTAAAMFVTANQVHKLDAASKLNNQNGYNGIETEGTVRNIEEVTWPVFADGANYVITNDLFFDSGVKIQNTRNSHAGFLFAADKALYVRGNGYINVKGTSNFALFIFKGKNHNNNGSWKGISISTNSPQNQLNFVQINNAGSSNLTGFGDLVSLGVRGTVNLTNSTVRNSAGYGIFVKRDGTINASAATGTIYENNAGANFFKEQ